MSEDFVRVAEAGAVPEGKGRVYQVGERSVAVFNVSGELHAIDNLCPHVGGPLGEGQLRGTTIYCPWHQWPFDVTTGCLERPPEIKVARFGVKVEGADLLVSLTPLPE